jgi:hypothetical protein
MYMYQFGQYAWTHMILLTVFVPSSFFVSNVFEGLIWFLLPCALIIVNDIMAYLAGGPWGEAAAAGGGGGGGSGGESDLRPPAGAGSCCLRHSSVGEGVAHARVHRAAPARGSAGRGPCQWPPFPPHPTPSYPAPADPTPTPGHPTSAHPHPFPPNAPPNRPGFFFGRTPLIKLSPKKTWEGFIGGVIGTVISGYLLAAWFSRLKWMTCPRQVGAGPTAVRATAGGGSRDGSAPTRPERSCLARRRGRDPRPAPSRKPAHPPTHPPTHPRMPHHRTYR